jgi:hypothetical protein
MECLTHGPPNPERRNGIPTALRGPWPVTLPTFFIIGAAKCGTSSLHLYLDQHPEIQMSHIKEPSFFVGPENGIPYPPDRVVCLDTYERLFDPGYAVRGEASPEYASYPRRHGVPERIKARVPDARFIYLVRDPIERTVSHYKMRVALQGERRSLSDALSDLADFSSPYIAFSLYASQLALYLDQFPQERILVVDQAELLENRRCTLAGIFAFLSVTDSFDSERFDEKRLDNQEWRTYPRGYVHLLDRTVVRWLNWLPVGVRRSMRRSVERALWPPLETPKLDDELRSRLQELYADEIERLRVLTGQTFPSWSV